MGPGKKTCIVYCRTSTTRQKESETIKAQVQRCKALVERYGLEVLPWGPDKGWVKDDGTTGTLLDARSFAKLLDDFEARKVKPDYLVVFSISRIARVDRVSKKMDKLQASAAAAARIQSTLIGSGVHVLDEEGPLDPSSLIFGFKLLLASEEHKEFSKRSTSGKTRRLGEGKYARGGRPPYGYVTVPHKGERKHGFDLAIHPEEGPRLRQILDWYIEGGPTHAARKATAAEYPTPMHKTDARKNKSKDWTPTKWDPVSVQHIARNVRAYLGEMTLEFDGKAHTIKYDPLIDGDRYMAVERRKKTKTLKRRTEFLTTGLVDCVCGHHLHEKNSHDKHYARCTEGCGSVPQKILEGTLWTATIARLIQIQRHERTTLGGPDPYGPQLAVAKGKLAQAQTEIDRLLDLYLTGAIDKTTWAGRHEPLKDRKAQADAELEQVARERQAHEERRANEKSVEARVEETLQQLVRGTPTLEERRKVLSNLIGVEKVIVGWPKRKTDRGKRPKLSEYASITLPKFGALPPVTVRTNVDVWTTMLGGLVQGVHLEGRGSGRPLPDLVAIYMKAAAKVGGRVTKQHEVEAGTELEIELPR